MVVGSQRQFAGTQCRDMSVKGLHNSHIVQHRHIYGRMIRHQVSNRTCLLSGGIICGAAKSDQDGEDQETTGKKNDDDAEEQKAAFSGRRRRRRNKRIEEDQGQLSLEDFNPIAIGRKSRKAFDSVVAADGENLTLDDLNPISMGKRSRKMFDDVWSQLQKIGGPSRGGVDLEAAMDLPEVFDSPQATATTVLVVGATGRVGKVLVRKLLLRGYSVKALVRRRMMMAEGEEDVMESIPRSVQVIEGDLGDYKACREAVNGVDKVLFCAAARSTLTADLNRVDADGVALVARALQDSRNAVARQHGMLAPTAKPSIADFGKVKDQEAWDIMHIGPDEEDLEGTGYYAQTRRKALSQARDSADALINDNDHLVFTGAVYSRNAYAIVGADLDEQTQSAIASSDGLVMRILGDGQTYSALLETEDGRVFAHRIKTSPGFATVRIPWTLFAPEVISDDDLSENILEPREIAAIGIKFEPSKKALGPISGQGMYDNTDNRFSLEIDWIKALPGGIETDFILVSCGGAQRSDWDFDESVRDRVVTAKRKGESSLRSSGLGYTIVRPGALVEEAGGYKALVFDQGNRITQPVACADVADVCLKALHDPLARNKTFEVCWEYTPEEGLENYELVAHLPDKANNYLSPALESLQSNT